MTRLIAWMVFALVSLQGCKTLTGGRSDFQSANDPQTPICYDLTGTLFTSPPDRDALSKVDITTYHIGRIPEAISYVQNRFDHSSPLLQQGMFIEEAAAITLYTERAYGDINTSLYKRDCEKTKLFNMAIASGLNKTAALHGTTYRGGEIRDNELSNYVPGKEIIASAFLSATTDYAVADRFKRNALFEIDAQGLGYIGWLSVNGGEGAASDEGEVLIPPGSKFTIQSVEVRGSYKYVKMKQISKSKAQVSYPAQPPKWVVSMNQAFTKTEFPRVAQALADHFPLGVYHGNQCDISLAVDSGNTWSFSLTGINQPTVVVDSAGFDDHGGQVPGMIQTAVRLPETDISLLLPRSDYLYREVTFVLNAAGDWIAVEVGNGLTNTRCTFAAPIATVGK